MRININLDDGLMEELLRRTKARSKTQAVELAIRRYMEMQAVEDLIALSGTIDIDSDRRE